MNVNYLKFEGKIIYKNKKNLNFDKISTNNINKVSYNKINVNKQTIPYDNIRCHKVKLVLGFIKKVMNIRITIAMINNDNKIGPQPNDIHSGL